MRFNRAESAAFVLILTLLSSVHGGTGPDEKLWQIGEGPFDFDSETVGSKPSGWTWHEYPAYPWTVQNDESVSLSNSLKSSLPNGVIINQAFRPTNRINGAIETWMRHDQGVVGIEGVQEFGFRFRYKDDLNFYHVLAGINYIGIGKRVSAEASCDPITGQPATNWIALARIAGPGAQGPTFNNLTSTFSSPNNVWQHIRVEIWSENDTSDHLRAYADAVPILDAIDPCPNFRTGGIWGVFHWNWASCPSICNQWYDNITIYEPSTPNNPPVLAPIGDQTVGEETPLTMTATATDPDGDPLTFSLGPGAPSGVSITATGIFTWTPTEVQGPSPTGGYKITIIVSDGTLTASETIAVTVQEDNKAPALAVPDARTVIETSPVTFVVSVSDPDIPSNAITLSAIGLPLGATFNPLTGEFGWTPTPGQAGEYTVTFTASDDGIPSLSDTKPVSITVQPVPEDNRPPVLEPVGDKTVIEGALLTFVVRASDPDGDTLVFSLDGGAPEGASVTSAGLFSWTPTDQQGPGTYSSTVIVSDGRLTDSEAITIAVMEDHPPSWPADTTLEASNVGQTSLTLTWSAATDEIAVVGYQIYDGTILLDTVSSSIHSHTVTGLEPGREYTFSIEAGDTRGNWSNDGPSLAVSTLHPQTPLRPDILSDSATFLAIILAIVLLAVIVFAIIVVLPRRREGLDKE